MAETPIIDAIFDAFGGPTELAKAIDEPVTTVHSWKGSKYGIPRWRRPQILKVSDRAATPLSPEALSYLKSGMRVAA
jgi:hypothetical protein